MTNRGTDGERQPRKSQLEREITYDSFLLAILDDRDKISDTLIDKARVIDTACFGFHTKNYEPPEALDHFILPYSPLTLDVTASLSSDGISTIDALNFFPEDSAPFSIRSHGEHAVILHGDDEYLTSSDITIDALRQLVPIQVRDTATPTQILTYVIAFSPESNTTIEYLTENENFRGIVRFSKVEAANDTTDRLEIIKYFQHPSNAEVGTRMTLIESLNVRANTPNPDESQYELTIDAIYENELEKDTLTVDSLFSSSNRTTPVKLATRRHIQDIADVLATLGTPDELAALKLAE